MPVQPVGVAAQTAPLSKTGPASALASTAQLSDFRGKNIAAIVLTADVSASLQPSSEGCDERLWWTSTAGLAGLGNSVRKS